MTTLATQLSLPGQNGPRGTGYPVECMNCEASHKLTDCDKFKNMTMRQRRTFVRGRCLCLNCLKKEHFVSQCFAKSRSNLCAQKHHLLLHNAALDHIDPPCQSHDQVKVTAGTMMGDCSTFSASQTQYHVRVCAKVMTADGGTSTAFTCDQAASETPTISTVHFAKSAS